MPDLLGGLRGWVTRYLNTPSRADVEEIRRDLRLTADEIMHLRDTVSVLATRIDRDLGNLLSNAALILQKSVDRYEKLSSMEIRQDEQESRFDNISNRVAELQKSMEINKADLESSRLMLKVLGKNLDSAGEHMEKITSALFERIRILEHSKKPDE